METPHFDAELHTLDNLSQIQANPPDAEICDKFKYKDFRGCKSVSQIQIRVTRMSSRSIPTSSQLYASPDMWLVYTNTKIAQEKTQIQKMIRINRIKI